MTTHRISTREEWLEARIKLLEEEKEITRRSDALVQKRQELPWVRIDKDYRFETDSGSASLRDLFDGRSQLLIYHFMFGPHYTAGCPSCSAIADGFNGVVTHLANHDVTLSAVSRAPLANLQAYRRRMGWTFPWASSLGSDFNFDFNISFTEEAQRSGTIEYNYGRSGRAMDPRSVVPEPVTQMAATCGTDVPTYTRERPGLSSDRLRRCLSLLLGVRAWGGRPLGNVPVAGQGSQGTQRSGCLVAQARRVRQALSPVVTRCSGASASLWIQLNRDLASYTDFS